ncbi:response regulator [Paenibacillus xerothermodurans]|uniref:response regulator n=1 Tax=Paenibacillus xerothermodurans TaxID=1977292 RepID=UPI001403042C|nr:response regulator [Paenibacillus xerothermodurans]
MTVFCSRGVTMITVYQRHFPNNIAAKRSILLLEDDANLAKLIQVALGKLKLPIVPLRSAEEGLVALQHTANVPPRLCIVDIHLEGTGWDFISELYRHPLWHRTPVIGRLHWSHLRVIKRRTVKSFLRQPFTMEKLLQVAEKLLHDANTGPTYILPPQDENLLSATLTRNGIQISEMKRDDDTIHVELKHVYADEAAAADEEN